MSGAEEENTAHLRFSPSILARLGEELTPDADQGILELVRNAWDADARRCTVALHKVITENHAAHLETTGPDETPSIVITDDGDGMTVDEVRRGWLLLGSSKKRAGRLTRAGRPVIGNKGLGRLAALRLGRVAVLRTRPRGAGVEHQVTLDWEAFDLARTVEEVEIRVETTPTSRESGTDITISDLRRPMRRREAENLARELVLLADPFGDPGSFFPELLSGEFQDLARLVQSKGYFDAARFRVTASLTAGSARADLYDRSGKKLFSTDTRKIAGPYDSAPDATMEVWTYRLVGADFASDSFGLNAVQGWLRVVGGVHLYHRGLRVRPYGDPGNDWLDMNLARARSPEEATSTNNTLGVLTVNDPAEVLDAKTDRLGFADNDAFSDLKRFSSDVLAWLFRWRLDQAEARRKAANDAAAAGAVQARREFDKSLREVSRDLPEAGRQALGEAAKRLESAAAKREEGLAASVDLYRSLATVGATFALFAHEWNKPAEQLPSLIAELVAQGEWRFGNDFTEQIGDSIKHLQSVGEGLRAYVKLPLRMLQHERRRREVFDVESACTDVTALFAYPLQRTNVSLVQRLSPAQVRGVPAAFEVMVANLLANAISAVERSDRPNDRVIEIGSVVSEGWVSLTVSDSGSGITGVDPSSIWSLGVTTTQGGTGIGLAIVSDTAADLGGSVDVRSPGDLGGASFDVRLPVVD